MKKHLRIFAALALLILPTWASALRVVHDSIVFTHQGSPPREFGLTLSANSIGDISPVSGYAHLYGTYQARIDVVAPAQRAGFASTSSFGVVQYGHYVTFLDYALGSSGEYTLEISYLTDDAAPTATATPTFTPTATRTVTVTSTATRTKTPRPTQTVTLSKSPSPTKTATRTVTPAYTKTATPTNSTSPTITRTKTSTLTRTVTPNYTATKTFTRYATATRSVTQTRTSSPTPVVTATPTATKTATPTISPSPMAMLEGGEHIEYAAKNPASKGSDFAQVLGDVHAVFDQHSEPRGRQVGPRLLVATRHRDPEHGRPDHVYFGSGCG